MRKNLVFTPLMALIAAGSHMYAQDLTSAVLAARVTTPQGQPLQGVRVQVQSPALLGPRNTVTDANGSYRMPLLPSGQARITYTLDGYITRQLTVTLTAGQVSNANATMAPIAVQQTTVEIVGSSTAQIDKTDTVVQASFTNEQMNVLMRAGDLMNAHALVPAVAGANLYGRPIIRGGTGRAYKILYNGVPVGDQFGGGIYSQAGQDNLFLQDMIESFAVLLSPSNARYGGSDGGVTSFVSKKGGNEFKGTLRVADMRRSSWEARNQPYPRRDGSREGVGTASAPSDVLSKRYEFTIEGPLWKDHLSFTYGGVLRPKTYAEWWPGRDVWSRPEPLYTNAAGTFFQNQYGDIVRRSELGVRSDVNTVLYRGTQATHNQFTLFAQITPNHQLEYLYKEARVNGDYWGRDQNGYLGDLGYTDRVDSINEPTRDWSIGYKGILGTSGVLDFRFGKHTYLTELTNATGKRIQVRRLPSLVPYAGMGTLGDVSNYANFDAFYTNGFVQAGYDPRISDAWSAYNALDNDTVDGGITTSIMLNYQHYLTTAVGNHVIDLGYQSDHLNWLTKIYDNAQYWYYSPGRLPLNLTEADVYRSPNNTPIGGTGQGDRWSAADMAGKYIVWNMRTATLGSIDPYGLQWAINNPNVPLSADQPLYPVPANSRNLSVYYPRLVERYGNESGQYWTHMQSYYINDLWTLNDNHSVMLGLRLDNFKVWDSVRDVHSYMQPSFRFNYKWDLYGDQSRLVSIGINQYHAQISSNLFYPFVEARMLNSRTMYWDQGSATPYLVSQAELMNPENYGYKVADTVAGSMGGKIDDDFKMPVSTEFSISFARNFASGGSFKISYNQRTWSNLYDIYPGEIVRMPSGLNQMQRVLKNTTEFTRSYKNIEMEWSVPITRRLEFGGNYTFARLMHNQSGISTTETDIRNAFNSAEYVMIDHWNSIWPREAWNPTLLANSEHMLNWWFTCDLTSGKTKSSLALRGRYDSNGYVLRTYNSIDGRPIIDGVYDFNGNINTTGLVSSKSILVGKSKNDAGWNTTVRYNLELPLYRRLAWFVTAEMSNPFNHRGRSGSGIVGFSMPTSEVLRTWREPDGTQRTQNLIQNIYNGNYYQANANYWSSYMGRMSIRSLTLQTGLRF